jgi:hypothetical protein
VRLIEATKKALRDVPATMKMPDFANMCIEMCRCFHTLKYPQALSFQGADPLKIARGQECNYSGVEMRRSLLQPEKNPNSFFVPRIIP